MGTAKLKKPIKLRAEEKTPPFLRHYGPALLGLLVLILVVHDIFGAHGYLAMRRTQQEIQKVNSDLHQLNNENLARDELGLARPGEVIIKIPRSQQLPQDSVSKP
jgi:cell division protein FtsB